ncbi:hypothetical protein C84B14_14159 [Salinisphaera sp. C84B14]
MRAGMMESNAESLALIGLGPRGINVLERLTAFASLREKFPLQRIYLIDPTASGEGIHEIEQPDHMLLNTVASQITMFMDHTVEDSGPILPGPNLHDWALLNAPKYLDDGPNTYLPRKVFGRYMRWVYSYLSERLARYCDVIPVRHNAVELEREPGGEFRLALENGENYFVDNVILTTGHASVEGDSFDKRCQQFVADHKQDNPHLRYVAPCKSRMAEQLKDVAPAAKVAIQGMGLTAIDAVTTLTIGRGGWFSREHNSDGMKYHPSGKEPSIILYSRSGLPLSARAVNRKRDDEQHQARFFTPRAVSMLKTLHGKLDFETHVLPLLMREMRHAFFLSHASRCEGNQFARLLDLSMSDSDESRADEICAAFFPDAKLLSWTQLSDPIPSEARSNYPAFRDWLLRFFRTDVQNASEGNVDNPYKAACDVLRDTRDVLRSCIDHGALTADSHRRFKSNFLPAMNRLAVGPPLNRMCQLIALVKSGHVCMDFGPGPDMQLDSERKAFTVTSKLPEGPCFAADVLVRAQIPHSDPLTDISPLMRAMIDNGLARPFQNEDYSPGGIDVDRNQRVIDRNGHPQPNAWALGTICEGAKFYTYIVPRPYVKSTALVDAAGVVNDLLERISSRASDRSTSLEDRVPLLQM